jgi:hypothetical protein
MPGFMQYVAAKLLFDDLRRSTAAFPLLAAKQRR